MIAEALAIATEHDARREAADAQSFEERDERGTRGIRAWTHGCSLASSTRARSYGKRVARARATWRATQTAGVSLVCGIRKLQDCG
jgi:hypothetical protein